MRPGAQGLQSRRTPFVVGHGKWAQGKQNKHEPSTPTPKKETGDSTCVPNTTQGSKRSSLNKTIGQALGVGGGGVGVGLEVTPS